MLSSYTKSLDCLTTSKLKHRLIKLWLDAASLLSLLYIAVVLTNRTPIWPIVLIEPSHMLSSRYQPPAEAKA